MGNGPPKEIPLASRHVLSKSTFLRGLQCPKSLYLDRFHKELRDPLAPETQAMFKVGHEVGQLARGLFPGGVLARAAHPWNVAASIARTRQLIDRGESILYEAALQHEGVLAYVDILVRQGEAWRLYEVKSATSVKPVNIPDAGVQAYILRGNGLQLEQAFIVHLNNQYVRQGELELDRLFTIASVQEQIDDLQGEIGSRIQALKEVLRGGTVPQIDIGPQCFDPYDCDFMGHCWAHIPHPSVFDVARLHRDQAFQLYRDGIVRIEDIPDGYSLSARSRFHVQQHRRGEVLVDREGIQAFLDTLSYPLYYLDFETCSPAIPPFDGTKPYGHIPFQYSLHRRESPSAQPQHAGFLAEAGSDPRRPLVESLLRDTAAPGPILVYYQPFEGSRIGELAEQLPEYASELAALHDRLRDLILPFQGQHYYHPQQHGSNSIKAVLPAIVPGMDYQGLAISDGSAAMLAYQTLHEEQDPRRVERLRRDLWEYCKQDTLAMVRILEELERLAG